MGGSTQIAATTAISILTFGLLAAPAIAALQDQPAIYAQCMEERGYQVGEKIQK